MLAAATRPGVAGAAGGGGLLVGVAEESTYEYQDAAEAFGRSRTFSGSSAHDGRGLDQAAPSVFIVSKSMDADGGGAGAGAGAEEEDALDRDRPATVRRPTLAAVLSVDDGMYDALAPSAVEESLGYLVPAGMDQGAAAEYDTLPGLAAGGGGVYDTLPGDGAGGAQYVEPDSSGGVSGQGGVQYAEPNSFGGALEGVYDEFPAGVGAVGADTYASCGFGEDTAGLDV